MDEASAVSRMRENRLSGSMWREPETEMTVCVSGTLAPKGRNSQGSQDLQHPPRRLPTRLEFSPASYHVSRFRRQASAQAIRYMRNLTFTRLAPAAKLND